MRPHRGEELLLLSLVVWSLVVSVEVFFQLLFHVWRCREMKGILKQPRAINRVFISGTNTAASLGGKRAT